MHQVLIRFVGGTALAAATALALAQTPTVSPVPATHPLLGAWRATAVVAPTAAASGAASSPGKPVSCSETMDFRATRIRLGTSGAEITRASYDVAATPSPEGFYRLAHTILEANGKPDCAGDLHSKTDDTVVRFIQFSPKKDLFIVCQSASLAACYGPFRKQAN